MEESLYGDLHLRRYQILNRMVLLFQLLLGIVVLKCYSTYGYPYLVVSGCLGVWMFRCPDVSRVGAYSSTHCG